MHRRLLVRLVLCGNCLSNSWAGEKQGGGELCWHGGMSIFISAAINMLKVALVFSRPFHILLRVSYSRLLAILAHVRFQQRL